MVSKSLLGLLGTTCAYAASSSVISTSLIVPGSMPATITASVVDAKNGMTTWALGCGDLPCLAYPDSTMTFTQNPTTITFETTHSYSGTDSQEYVTIAVGCDINTSQSSITCSSTARADFPSPSPSSHSATTTVFTTELSPTGYFPVVVTAGADKLSDEEGAALAPAPTRGAVMAGVAALVGGAALVL